MEVDGEQIEKSPNSVCQGREDLHTARGGGVDEMGVEWYRGDG